MVNAENFEEHGFQIQVMKWWYKVFSRIQQYCMCWSIVPYNDVSFNEIKSFVIKSIQTNKEKF
jgi:hypothetical protein